LTAKKATSLEAEDWLGRDLPPLLTSILVQAIRQVHMWLDSETRSQRGAYLPELRQLARLQVQS
jgi:hypothetical protein